MNTSNNDSFVPKIVAFNMFTALKNPRWAETYKKKAFVYSYFLMQHMYWIFARIAYAWLTNIQFLKLLIQFSCMVIPWAKVSYQSNYHNEFCRCIECRYKESWLYCLTVKVSFEGDRIYLVDFRHVLQGTNFNDSICFSAHNTPFKKVVYPKRKNMTRNV